jgi:hypothetical protein
MTVRTFTAAVTAVPPPATGYTATHYVTANATGTGNGSLGSPWTLAQAMAQAVAGNQVRVAPGVYSGLWNSGLGSAARYTAVFRPANSGTAASPIVFFAQNPATANYGSTSLYSELRHNGAGSDSIASSPAMGATGVNYVIFDGFYAKFSTAYPAPSGGTFCLHTTTGSHLRRIVVDVDISIANTSTYNPNAIWCAGATSSFISDCRFEGSPGVHLNGSHIELADPNHGFTIQNCTSNCINGAVSIFVKGGSTGGQGTNITLRNNYCRGGLLMGNVNGGDVYNNLVVSNSGGIPGIFGFRYYPDMGNVRVYNNTFVLSGDQYVMGVTYHRQPTVNFRSTSSRFYDNIVRLTNSTLGQVMNTQPQGGGVSYITNASVATDFDLIDRNVYYAGGSQLRHYDAAGTLYTGIAAWRAGLAGFMGANARETNSTEGDPLFVGASDYHLQAGSPARTGIGGRTTTAGCYITGTEEIGVRANPTY